MDILKSPKICILRFTQLSPTWSINECNSAAVSFAESMVNHTEGGWPKVQKLFKYYYISK